jgi:site-specific recombinase XerD
MKKPLHTEEFQHLYREYDRMIESKGYRTGGGYMYQYCLLEFLWWLEQRDITKAGDVTTRHTYDHLEYLLNRPNQRDGGPLSGATINHHLYSMRLFFAHLLDTGTLREIPRVPDNVEPDHQRREALTEQEIRTLYDATGTKVERAILSLAYGCGLRRSELEALDVGDLNFGKGVLVVNKGKGNKVRDVVMSDAVITDLRDYMFTERLDRVQEHGTGCRAYFLNYKGQRLSADHIYKKLKALIERTDDATIKAKKPTLHHLRHSIATHLANRGMPMTDIRRFLGHNEIDTTSLYMIRRKRKNKYLI